MEILTAHGSGFFDFGFYVSDICLFLCSSLMRFFVVQNFSFCRTVCGKLRSFDEFIVRPIIINIIVVIVAEAVCSVVIF